MKRHSENEIKQWKIMHEVGFSYREISPILNISHSVISYHLNPEVREHRKEYYKRSEVREHQRGYWRRPEVRERKREYYRRPEVREHQKDYWRGYRRKRSRSVLDVWRGCEEWLSTQGIKERAGSLEDFQETLPILETMDANGETLYRPKGWVLKSLNST